MKRPDIGDALGRLKGFQRRTVDHAFERLFLAQDSAHRFLVADEVGLGKTLVARGIVARTIDHLWDSVERIDIIYICSNAAIAQQNLQRIRVSGATGGDLALATRLTMLATQLARRGGQSLADSKLNFVSFTPGTSFKLGESTGRWRERTVLFELVHPLVGGHTRLANFFQGYLTDHRWWRRHLKEHPPPIEEGIRARFEAEFVREGLGAEMEILAHEFRRIRKQWPPELRSRRNRMIKRLREMVAGVCVAGLEPDLVILDEFQRFKNLLETRESHRDPAAVLAQQLFGATTPEGNPVRTLLLSATPYKLYTTDAEIEHEDHYEDFLSTSRFLWGGDERPVEQLRASLGAFGGALKRAATGAPTDVPAARDAVQAQLRKIMARTERVSSSSDRDAMVESQRDTVEVDARDVRQYLASDALFRAVEDRDPLVFWKAAPYLAHFMRGYKFDGRLAEKLEHEPQAVAEVVQRFRSAFLTRDSLLDFARIHPDHGKLRELLLEIEERGTWKLLWMPPTISYWPAVGAFEGHERTTKSLLFSAWNVVPDVVSAIVSYEVERLMCGGALGYRDPAEQQGPLLRLSQSEGKRSAHRSLLLLLPCMPLAQIHPLDAPAGMDRVEHVRHELRERLDGLRAPVGQDVDTRWEWAFPMLLDAGLDWALDTWRKEETRTQFEAIHEYVADLKAIGARPQLGAMPDDLLELLVDVALGSPAVLALRALLATGVEPWTARRYAVRLAEAFWALFNRPMVIRLLRGLYPGAPYWRAVLRYCRDGNLQAVLDEALHLALEQFGWGSDKSAAEAAIDHLADAVRPTVARVHLRTLEPVEGGKSRDVRIRTDYALRFGRLTTDDQRQVSQDQVRHAFNSPFRPFLLASTSVGQEGLDFHPWCHRLIHWNLPGNPVDLEQREGRVHRYKGHAVRRNVAAAFADAAIDAWRQQPGAADEQAQASLWTVLFDLATADARRTNASDLVPFWIAEGRCKVQRRVPMLPWTKEVQAFSRLERQLAAYRVVFGQPRQQELLRLLEVADLDLETLRTWVIDLSPPTREENQNV